MLILIDCRPLQYSWPDSERIRLIFQVVTALTRERQVRWLFLVDHTWKPGSFPGIPEDKMLIKRAVPGRAGWRLWYDWQIPRLTRKHRPAWVMLTGGTATASVPAPQCVWMPVHAGQEDKRQKIPLFAGRLMGTLRRAGSVICFSEKDRAWLAGRIAADKDKFVLLRPEPSVTAGPLTAGDKQRLKEKYAQGKEFFFTEAPAADEEAVVRLLKAFSLFKKRQLTNLQLVIAGNPKDGIKKKLETYKFRDDIHWCGIAAAREARVMHAAYAALILFNNDSLGEDALDAWTAGVPVLISDGNPLAEVAGDAVLAAGADDPAGLAGQMMAVYKDEVLRSQLIEKGINRLPEFAAGLTTERVWAVINRPYGIKK